MQVWDAASDLAPDFQHIDLMVAHNLRRVQNAMRSARLGPHHFAGSTGYGHGDLGRSALDQVYMIPMPRHTSQMEEGMKRLMIPDLGIYECKHLPPQSCKGITQE